jgi:hypothetical protein
MCLAKTASMQVEPFVVGDRILLFIFSCHVSSRYCHSCRPTSVLKFTLKSPTNMMGIVSNTIVASPENTFALWLYNIRLTSRNNCISFNAIPGDIYIANSKTLVPSMIVLDGCYGNGWSMRSCLKVMLQRRGKRSDVVPELLQRWSMHSNAMLTFPW